MVNRKQMVLGFMFNDHKTDVLLIMKQKPEWQKGNLNGIGGKVEKGETHLQAMCREFKEETGIEYSQWNYVITMFTDEWEVQVFTAISDDVFYAESKEAEQVHLININYLDYYPHITNLQWLIPMCLDQNGNGNIDYFISNQL